MDLPARMDQAGIIDSDDSNIEQARGCKSTGIVKTGMMERTERQVVTILEHGTLDSAHATTSIGNSELLRRVSHTTAALSRRAEEEFRCALALKPSPAFKAECKEFLAWIKEDFSSYEKGIKPAKRE